MSKPKSEPRCDACRYWCEDRNHYGDCRIRSPTITPVREEDPDMETYLGVWPSVTADDWCGEFAPIEAQP